ncbi:hypothetical protein RM572_27090 [Streptomyces sp. DSM 42041]|uniref:TnsA-like heteromeric transposase endonuclease subunit n=1 Tax=Streptomyces hazeniae TaxID=3075538 RepID=A0ABU2P0A3_9ACTN|nr:hypothetical protein [Streptomyces sp. DSM 42041]MDT0382429.1 hypothetical protein [Streptomyces sp. DSM 42041]
MLRDVPLEERGPLEEPRAYQGRRSKLTRWFAATTGRNVWCVSTVHRDAAMLLDFDPGIECFQSHVARVRWHDDGGAGSSQPAFFARSGSGQRLALVHPSSSPQEREAVQVAAEAAGWTVREMAVPRGALCDALTLLAHFRAAEFADAEARRVLLEVFARPRLLAEGAAASGLGLAAMSRAWHLLWTGDLTFDWDAALTPMSMVWTSGKDTKR